MKRLLGNLTAIGLAVLSAVLCLAVCVLWVRASSGRRAHFYFNAIDNWYGLVAEDRLSLRTQPIVTPDDQELFYRDMRIRDRQFFGGAYVEMQFSPRITQRSLEFEYWFAAAGVASGTLPLCAHLLMTLRRRRTPGFCPRCGYDVRASPDRCPECGRAPAVLPPLPCTQGRGQG